MITRLVKMTFREDKIEEFLAIFRQARERIRAFEGCERLDLYRDRNRPAVIFTYSIWRDDESLQAYRKSALFRDTWSKTKVLFERKAEAWSLVKDK